MYQIILFIHVIAGTASLVAGLMAIIWPKGKLRHTLSGTWFYISMYVVGATALVMSLMKWNPFLLSIGILSAYLAYSGKQCITYWRLKEQYQPRLLEKIPLLIAFITGVLMIAHPLWQMIRYEVLFLPISLIFGVALAGAAVYDFTLYQNPANFAPRNKYWLLRHIGMMGGAYISTVTAFLVVNVNSGPGWVPWLGPSIIGSAIISYAIGKWKAKLYKTSSKPV